MDKDVEKFLSAFPELQHNEHRKIKCSLSGHEMPCQLNVLQAYTRGKKFKSLRSHNDFDYSQLLPYIAPSQKRKHRLFCALTNRYINRKPDEVNSHVRGKRYKRALQLYKAGEKKLHSRGRRRQEKEEDEISSSDLFGPTADPDKADDTEEDFEIVRENGIEVNCKLITELGGDSGVESSHVDGRDNSKEEESLSGGDVDGAIGVAYATTRRRRNKVVIARKLLKMATKKRSRTMNM